MGRDLMRSVTFVAPVDAQQDTCQEELDLCQSSRNCLFCVKQLDLPVDGSLPQPLQAGISKPTAASSCFYSPKLPCAALLMLRAR